MMKFTLIATVAILSTLSSGLRLPDPTRLGKVFQPTIAIQIKEQFPETAFPATTRAEISLKNNYRVQTLLGFTLSACTGSCTVSLSDVVNPSGSVTMQLFTLGRYPMNGDTWNRRPYTNIHKGTFRTSATGSGPATVVEDFGLTFACPATTTLYGYILQPVWGPDYSVTWDINRIGLQITCGGRVLPLKVEALAGGWEAKE